jgi:hypothetical protein
VLFVVWTYGKVEIQFGQMVSEPLPPFNEPELTDELRRRPRERLCERWRRCGTEELASTPATSTS